MPTTTHTELKELTRQAAALLGSRWTVAEDCDSWSAEAVVLTAPAAARQQNEDTAPALPDPYRIRVYRDAERLRLWGLMGAEWEFADQVRDPTATVSAELASGPGGAAHLVRGINRVLRQMDRARAVLAQLRAQRDEEQAARRNVAELLREAAPGSEAARSSLHTRYRDPYSSVYYRPEHADGLFAEAQLLNKPRSSDVEIRLEVRRLTPQQAAAVFRTLAESLR